MAVRDSLLPSVSIGSVVKYEGLHYEGIDARQKTHKGKIDYFQNFIKYY